jgi:hypothetical protein
VVRKIPREAESRRSPGHISYLFILYHIDPLLGNDHDINKYRKAVTEYQLLKHVRMETIEEQQRKVFSMRSVPRCYNQDN